MVQLFRGNASSQDIFKNKIIKIFILFRKQTSKCSLTQVKASETTIKFRYGLLVLVSGGESDQPEAVPQNHGQGDCCDKAYDEE